jgi:LAS seventeen-binding protein 1/2
MLSQLPEETSVNSTQSTNGARDTPAIPFRSNSAINEKSNEKSPYYPTPVPAPAPPAYASTPQPPPPPVAPILTYAVALYAYSASDAGDLALLAGDRIAVTEYMNAEWWKGKSERTGAEGIFPRSYVRVEEKRDFGPPPPSNYGNMPMDVAQGAQQPADPEKKSTASKIGGKLGNAALFGAGGKFESICRVGLFADDVRSLDWKQYCQFDLLSSAMCNVWVVQLV